MSIKTAAEHANPELATSSGKDFHLRWAGLGAPQRPPPQVVAAMRPLLPAGGTALQLGVTPEIAGISAAGVAVDWNADMVRTAWPGDSQTHRAILGNWLALPLASGSVDAVFGDASLSVLGWPDECMAVLLEVKRVLRPGGRLVLRCFAGPDEPESLEQLAAAALAGEIASFGEFKLRFNMAAFQAPASSPNTGQRIHSLFRQYFPDPQIPAAASGWTAAEIGSMSAYAGSPALHCYPTRRQVGSALPTGFRYHFQDTAGYPMAQHCPLLVADLAGG